MGEIKKVATERYYALMAEIKDIDERISQLEDKRNKLAHSPDLTDEQKMLASEYILSFGTNDVAFTIRKIDNRLEKKMPKYQSIKDAVVIPGENIRQLIFSFIEKRELIRKEAKELESKVYETPNMSIFLYVKKDPPPYPPNPPRPKWDWEDAPFNIIDDQ